MGKTDTGANDDSVMCPGLPWRSAQILVWYRGKVINSVWDGQGKTTEWEVEFKLDTWELTSYVEKAIFPRNSWCVCVAGGCGGKGTIVQFYVCFVEVFSFHTLVWYLPLGFQLFQSALPWSFPLPQPPSIRLTCLLSLFFLMWQSGCPGKETWNPLSFSFMSLILQLAYKSQQPTSFLSILLRPLTFLYTRFSCESLKATRDPPRRALGEGERTFPRDGAFWTMGPTRPPALAEKKPPL